MVNNPPILATLRAKDDFIVLETMFYPDEIVQPAESTPEVRVEVAPKELELAESLIENMTSTFTPEKYEDHYRQKLAEIIQKKIAGEEVVALGPREEKAEVIDIMTALKKSLEKANFS